MIKWRFTYLAIPLLLAGAGARCQQKLTLDQCYQLARQNYPAIKKLDLIARSSQYTVENANKQYLPQLTISGQASYQSQTVSFPEALGTPGLVLPSISKDQYKIQAELDQQLYDGGATRSQNEATKANAALQLQNIEVNLYTLRDRINNIYFSVLLMNEQLAQNEINKASLETQAQKTEAAFANGVAYKSNVDELKAEITSQDMASTEYRANRTAYVKMLGLLIGQPLPDSVQLALPDAYTAVDSISRPELKAYDLQKDVFNAQEKQLKADYLPKFSAFIQGAYGRPTLNFIDNAFGPWWIAGLRMNWSLGSLYSLGNHKKILAMNRSSVDADRETFLLNTKLDISQQDEQVKKYTDLIRQDEQVISLRESVTSSAAAQLANGVTTTHEYIQQVNAANSARQSLILHRIQLLQAQYNQKFKSGN